MGKDWPEGFNRLGLRRSVDLLLHFPLRYEDESQVCPLAQVRSGDSVQCQVRVVSARLQFKPRRSLIVEVEDETGLARLRFFYFHSSYQTQFEPGRELRVLGEARRSGAQLDFVHPSVRAGWLSPEALADQPLVPIYPTTQGLAQTVIRRHIQRVLQTSDLREWLEPEVLQRANVLSLPQALEQIHRPSLSRHGAPAVGQIGRAHV